MAGAEEGDADEEEPARKLTDEEQKKMDEVGLRRAGSRAACVRVYVCVCCLVWGIVLWARFVHDDGRGF